MQLHKTKRSVIRQKPRPPRPPRLSAEDMLFYYFGCQKIIEGSIFRVLDRSQNLLSELDLGGPWNLRSDL